MKDRIEVCKVLKRVRSKDGKRDKLETYLKFYVHCDLGTLYLNEWKSSMGVYDYFKNGRSASELFDHRYGKNRKLNHIVERLPAYIKQAKANAAQERTCPSKDAAAPERGRLFEKVA